MSTAGAQTRVSTFFGLARDQASLDFVDVPIGTDIPVFLDPSRLRTMNSVWATECQSLLQHFFDSLLQCVRNGDEKKGVQMLEGLNERNEFHLGLSKGISQGSGVGPKYARKLWRALKNSRAGTTGLLRDLEDACLFVEGVGPDRISDSACNILRAPLVKYTQDMCVHYGIPMTQDVQSGPMWNAEEERWEDALVELPITPFGRLMLIPKIVVRHRLVYDPQNYYSHFLLPEMQEYEKRMNSGLVHTLKSGKKRVTKKSLRATYGADKIAIAQQSAKFPDVLERYREVTSRKSQPISHVRLAEVESRPSPRFDLLLKAVLDTKPGIDEAPAYEKAIEALLSALFYPSLCTPFKQDKIHEGRKRVDITYVNAARDGFFAWVGSHHPAAHIFVECKNYGKEIKNPDLDQLAGRFSPSRGKVGLLVCRSLRDRVRIEKGCRDTADDHRGFMICLTDDDLKRLVEDYIQSNNGSQYPLLMERFRKLVM